MIVNIISLILIFATVALAIPVGIFFIEAIAAILPPRQRPLPALIPTFRPRIAVLIPAHNETTGILPTLADIRDQIRDGDRVLVVADNCTDDTAVVAAAAGADVIRRNDASKIGKGYALDWGLRHLEGDPPDIVVIVDADCRIEDKAVDRLVTASAITGRPAQALYLMAAPEDPTINYQVAEFAWRVKNWLRPLSLSALNLPCQLMGTGMAFPWNLIRVATLADGQIVEDLKLGLDLAAAGAPPLFCADAIVRSVFPSSIQAANNQRQRWEQGHIRMIREAPRLIYNAITRRNLPLLVLTLDLAVPPLSLLAISAIAMFMVTALAWYYDFAWVPLLISALSLAALIVAVSLSWLKCGRDVLPPNAFLAVIPYVLRKLGLYGRTLTGRTVTSWVRTDRQKSR